MFLLHLCWFKYLHLTSKQSFSASVLTFYFSCLGYEKIFSRGRCKDFKDWEKEIFFQLSKSIFIMYNWNRYAFSFEVNIFLDVYSSTNDFVSNFKYSLWTNFLFHHHSVLFFSSHYKFHIKCFRFIRSINQTFAVNTNTELDNSKDLVYLR